MIVDSQSLSAGAFALFLEEEKLPIEERYIHSFIREKDLTLIVTGLKQLVVLIHLVLSFEADFTFKRVNEPNEMNLNEWEMVIFLKPAQRAVTILRVYMNRQDTASYTRLFDEVRDVVLRLTGRPLAFKRFEKDGTLLAMNVDMELAQVKGASASLMKTLDCSYSGITTKDPDNLAPFFTKLCSVHGKRGINDFRPRLTLETYNHILTYMDHIKSEEDVAKFDKFIRSIKCDKPHEILNWWLQKLSLPWILPCTVRALSKMDPEDWDATPSHTNTGEGQHAWTNRITGIGLRIVTAIVGVKEADSTALKEIEQAMGTGMLLNTQNELVHRETRNATCRQNRAEKTKAVDAAKNEQAELQMEIAENQARSKELKARMKELKSGSTSGGAVPKTRNVPAKESSSSRGRAKVGKKKTTKPNPKGKNTKTQSSSTSLRELSESEESDLPDLSSLYSRDNSGHNENATLDDPEPVLPTEPVHKTVDEAPDMEVDPVMSVTASTFAGPVTTPGIDLDMFNDIDWSVVMQGGASECSLLDPSLPNLTSYDPSFDASSFDFGFLSENTDASSSSFANSGWEFGLTSGFSSKDLPSSPPHGQHIPLPPPSSSPPAHSPLRNSRSEAASEQVVPAKQGERDRADMSCILGAGSKRQRKLSSQALGTGESALMAHAAERAEEAAREKPKTKRGQKPSSNLAK
ncbi:hypothetical protein V5O48_018019 [Marasmius crinis-equi]|uniref:Uncharacterized protein n=1 Tax=Marasmius crinis-equi TaxID=585013 RepID=A0ABR3EMD3_9AGAR